MTSRWNGHTRASTHVLKRQSSLLPQNSVTSAEQVAAGEHYLLNGFKYLYAATRITGLVFIKPSDGKWTVASVLSVIYYAVLLLLTWGNVARYALAYEAAEHFTPRLMVKVVIHIIYIFTALTYTVCMGISLKRSHIVRLWSTYYLKYKLSPRASVFSLQKHSLIFLTIIFIIWLCSIAVQLLEPLTDSPFGLLQIKPFDKGYAHLKEIPAWMTFCVTILNTFILIAYCLYMTWIVVIGLTLKNEYKSIIDDLLECEESDTLDIETIRMRHLDLSSVVTEVDGVVSFYILLIFVCNVPVVCIAIYHLALWDDLSQEYTIIIWLALAMSLAQLFSVISVGTWLNEKACHIKNELYRLSLHDGDNWPQLKMMQYLTFLNYVTEGNIGYTAWNIFYLRKHTLKMVVLWVLSYSVVLLKFGTALNPSFTARLTDNSSEKNTTANNNTY